MSYNPGYFTHHDKNIIQVITNSIITLLEYFVTVLTPIDGFPFKHTGSLYVNGK